MSDKLEWMNRHAVLLREPQWANLAARENYKIRADLRPLFDAHPDSLELLDAMAARGLYREGCEFIARMTHRRAAVWWGYCCLLSLLEERQEVAAGAPTALVRELTEGMPQLADQLKAALGGGGGIDAESIDNFCKPQKIDLPALLKDYEPPPQDPTALKAASAAVKSKASQLERLLPPAVREAYEKSHVRMVEESVRKLGCAPSEALARAKGNLAKGLVTYKVNRADSPTARQLMQLQDGLLAMRDKNITQIKATFPEKFPTTPEAKLLLVAEAKKRTDDALQAVWRWIVSPDERNTTLAMEAGNSAAGTPEGLLAFTAAWSFGDLAPEGKMTVPVPPELPGTGLNSVLLMLALDKGGTRKMQERYELYFKMGLDVVFGKNLWPDAVSEKLSPHVQLAEKWAKGGVK